MGAVAMLGIADNDRMALSALRAFLRAATPEWTIIWVVDSGSAAMRRCLDSPPRPDVLLLDVSMPDMDGIAVTRAIRAHDGGIAIVAMTAFPLNRYASAVSRAGAQAIVSKGDPRGIAEAIRIARDATTPRVYDDVRFDAPAAAFTRRCRDAPYGIDALSERENAIIDLCRQGWTSRRIAEYLSVSTTTVETHLRRALEKTGAHNRVQLVSMWLEHRSGQ